MLSSLRSSLSHLKKCTVYGCLLLLLLTSCKSKSRVTSFELLKYPSASSIEYVDSSFWIMGDDASYFLKLDHSFKQQDSIILFPSNTLRIAKDIKADIESSTMLSRNKILLLGSGSLSPQRENAFIIDIQTKRAETISLSVFYERLRGHGLTELNLEGACNTAGTLILANRGHQANRHNHLVITIPQFYSTQAKAPLRTILIGTNTDSAIFNGISGMSYSSRSDQLLLTVSTEHTNSAFEDGTIGTSYIWIIDNFRSKLTWSAINPDRVINLDQLDERFHGQKIESICIEQESKKMYRLVLVADNDNGTSSIFRLLLQKD